MSTTALIRPAWTPATIALTVVGFMVFWPLGLAMLAFILWGDRLPAFRRGGFSGGPWAGKWNCGSRRSAYRAYGRTGNVAFDDWREKELDRLNEERRKLDAMREDFDAYAAELRRAKDQEEFDRFMSRRNGGSGNGFGKPDVDVTPSKPSDNDLLQG